MNKLFMSLIFVVSVTFVAPSVSFADVAPESIPLEQLEGLSSNARKEVIDNYLEKRKSSSKVMNTVKSMDPESAQKWADLIVGTIRGVCNGLSMEVNEFVKSDVGKITAAIIIYEVVGEQILKTFFLVSVWFAAMLILFLSLRQFHMRKPIKEYDENKKLINVEYVERFEWHSRDAKTTSGCFHFGSGLLITVGVVIAIAAI